MIKLKIGDIVKRDRNAYFSHYRQGYLYYTITIPKTEGELTEYTQYSFPVEIEDLGQATLSNEEKSVFMMRYIRKALENETFVMIYEHTLQSERTDLQ
jgi:hypothetical protein